MSLGWPPIPRPIAPGYGIDAFDCGDRVIDAWLRNRALSNEANGASRTFVIVSNAAVVGFYSLAATAIERGRVTSAIRRNMPTDVPAVLLGRLAVDRGHQSRGIGRLLIRDALLRTLSASDDVGLRLFVCQVPDLHARNFYRRVGFLAADGDPALHFVDLLQSRRALLHGWASSVSEPAPARYG